MREAGFFMLLSAAMHLVAVVLSGFAADAMAMLWPALIYVALFAGLARGWMLAAWLSFLAMLLGISGAVAALFDPGGTPLWVFWTIAGADTLAAILLFGAIWKGRSGEHDRAGRQSA